MRSLPRCQTCYDLDLSKIPKPHRNGESCSIGQVAYHWIKSSELTASAHDSFRPGSYNGNSFRGCMTCLMLSKAAETLITQAQLVGNPQGGKFDDLEYQIAITDKDEDEGVGEKWSKKIKSGRPGSQSLHFILRVTPPGSKQRGSFQEEFNVELYIPPGAPPSPWPGIGRAGEVPTNPSGEECARIIQPWLQACGQYHKICQAAYRTPNQASLLPKRVLDLANNAVRLIETGGQIASYIALSHSWGKQQLLVTTRETYAARMRGIDLQNAISITRGLGIRYIWIDSLCIIQCDKLDWEQQSAVMANIYAGCYLNLATTRSSGGFEGCLGPRWTSTNSLAWADESDKDSKNVSRIRKHEILRLALESSHESLQTPRWIQQHVDTAPLLQRGWVYQERFLSPRTLVWVSVDGLTPGGDGWGASKDRIGNLGALRNDMKALHGLWRTIIEDYSLLDLTYETDRLAALSGLASRFKEYFPRNDHYLAGLWESDLGRDLLWECGGANLTKGPNRQRTAQGPSWSWASLAWGGVDGSDMDWEKESKPKLVSWGETVTHVQDPRFRILEASVQVDGVNPYGSVTSGRIVVRGATVAVVMPDSSKRQTTGRLAYSSFFTISEGSFNSLHLNYDTAGLEQGVENARDVEGRTVYCLFIGTFTEVFDDSPHGHGGSHPIVQLGIDYDIISSNYQD
ncbi:HET-domain-containing protein [Tricholoma matsutake]|nr:HET-domain-containing protein [Tricholoma matsutake 945]